MVTPSRYACNTSGWTYDRRQMAAQGDLMVFDRGSDHGLRGGQRLTIFRATAGGTGPIARIAEGVASAGLDGLWHAWARRRDIAARG